MIKDFVGRIKATKKLADDKSVHNWYNCLLQGIIIIFGSSLVLALYTMSLFKDVWETPVGELPFLTFYGLPILYSIILTYLLLEKLIIVQIYILEKFQKYLFKAWQNFDMWYYRKYRKTSPITEFLSKIEGKISKSKMSKTKRRIIMVSLVAFLIILNFGIRVPMIMEGMESETEIDTESELIETPLQEPERQIIVKGAG